MVEVWVPDNECEAARDQFGPVKTKMLGGNSSGIYKSRKRRPPYSRYNIRKRRFHLASYPNNSSLANQTNKSILPLRQSCWLAKRKAHAGLRRFFARQVRSTKQDGKARLRKHLSRHMGRRQWIQCPNSISMKSRRQNVSHGGCCPNLMQLLNNCLW